MSVYDRWHKSKPGPGDVPCKEHSRGSTKLYPTSEHLGETAGWSDGGARAVSSASAASPEGAGVTRRSVQKHLTLSGMLMRLAASGSRSAGRPHAI